jgi:hypothetical protein
MNNPGKTRKWLSLAMAVLETEAQAFAAATGRVEDNLPHDVKLILS